MSELKLGLFKTHNQIILPKFATQQSACFDLMCQTAGKLEYQLYTDTNKLKTRPLFNITGHKQPIYIGAGERVMIPTGIIMDIPKGHSVRIHSRSGLAFKSGLVLVNGEGVVDSDFIDEVMLLVLNVSTVGITVNDGDRIAQAELVQDLKYEFQHLTERPTTKTDRVGGFGSTGVQLQIGSTGAPIVNVTEAKKEVPVIKRGRGRPRLNRS